MGTNLIYLVLEDEKGKVSTYQVSLSLSLPKNSKKSEVPSAIFAPVERNDTETIITAKIEKISSLGEVKIKFSTAMKTNVNLSDLAEALEMYIVPESNWA